MSVNLKRAITIAAICVVVIVCVLLALVSCKTELDGTYTRAIDGAVSYSFEGDRFVKSENGEIVLEGTYSVYYGHIIFRYSVNGENSFDYLSYAQTRDLAEIQIGDSRFMKNPD